MRLRSLRLRNYRRFREASIEFPDGVIAITGPNGAGKSTLIEAITWCLFGHEAARTQKEFLKRAAAAAGEDAEVRIEFELDGLAYTMSRRIRGRSQQTEAQLEVDGALVVAPGANSSDLATRRIAKALGMDRRGFQATVVANQGDLSALSDTNPSERKRLILGLLGVDEIDEAIAFARAEKREALIRLEGVRRALERETELRSRLAQANDDFETTQASLHATGTEADQRAGFLQSLEGRTAALAQARDAERETRSRLDGLQRSLQARQEQATRLGAEIQLLEQRVQELSRITHEPDPFADLDAEWAALESYRAERSRQDALEAERARVHDDLTRWQTTGEDADDAAALAAVGSEIDTLRTRLETTAGRLAEHETHARHLDADRRRLQTDAAQEGDKWRDLQELGPEAACPVCERTLGEAVEGLLARARTEQAARQDRLEALRRERDQIQLGAEALRRSQDEDRRRLAECARKAESLNARAERRRVAEGERQRLALLVADVEQRLAARPRLPPAPDAEALERKRALRDERRQTLARLEAETARQPRLRDDLAALNAESETTRQEIEAATRDLAHIQYESGSWEASERQAVQERAQLHEAERRRDVLAERANGLRAILERLQADLGSLSSTREEARRLEDRVRIGELLAADRGDQGLLPEFKRHLIGRVRPALARAAAELTLEMTEGRYRELAIEEDYTIRVYDGGTAMPLERFSGGEVDVVNLAVRLAVSELLASARRASRLQFVALDEVLAGQDESRRRSVLAALKRLGTHFRQVLLVTHLDEVRERVDHVVRVTPQPDGTSRLLASWDDEAPAAPSRDSARPVEALAPPPRP